MSRSVFIVVVCLLVSGVAALAQTIRGEVLDMDGRKQLANVTIANIHTDFTVTSGDDGSFIIGATGGQLLEFRKGGYKTTRVRVPQGYMPSYFRIIIEKGMVPLKDVYVANSNRYDYKDDSIKYHELYKHELDVPKISGIEVIAHPFSAMSGKNREIWQFQDDFSEFEKERYVDKTFNDAIITKFTGLKGDSLMSYKRRYRPNYEQLKNMNDYNFYSFIRSSVTRFRNVQRPAIAH